MKAKTPLVSVVMPVRNAGAFLVEAINSILSQTYKNIELIVVDDASSDSTSKILHSFKKSDSRVKVVATKKNVGVAKSAGLGISHAKGQFVARMDADDVALPARIEKQVDFLFKNKGVIAVGGQCELINANGEVIGSKTFPLNDEEIKKTIFSHVPLQQPTLMVNTDLLPNDFVWYDENYSSAEELELLFKLFKYGKVRNLKDVVLKYRMHGKNTSLIHPKKTFFLTLKTRIIAILKYGYKPTPKGVVTTIVQAIVVAILPSRLIYPLYSFLRGMRRINAKIKFNAGYSFKKAFRFAQN